MCGIIGYVGHRNAAPILMSGLRRLEYRGYDSAGVALVSRGRLHVHKAAGKLERLASVLPPRASGRIGIGHTRWATHGGPTDVNAHPHVCERGRVAVVHNGIVENAAALRARLVEQGVTFASETDTEVLAHLISRAGDGELEDRVRAALHQVHGTYGIAVIDLGQPDRIVVARHGSPVIIGLGEREMFVASDVAALVRHAREVVHLDDGEIATVEAGGFRASTLDAQPAAKSPSTITWTDQAYERGEHAHFMRKEILDQPEAVARTLSGRLDHRFHTAHLGGLNLDARELLEVRRVKLLGCGTAYYAGLVGAHMVETLARIPASAEPAAEFRYRNPVIERDTLYVAISQSGETLDTLMAVQEVRRRGGRVLGVVNVVGSSIAREVDGGIYMHAGPEVSVASTKAYTCSVVALALLALTLGRVRDLSPEQGRGIVDALARLPESIAATLADEERVAAIAAAHVGARSAFFIGRAIGFPVALEGAQKLKEISYVHAEAYPASELKHGPLALVGPELPTVVVLPHDALLAKSVSALEEVRARGGPVIALTHAGDQRVDALSDHVITVPRSEDALNPVVMGIPLQMLAYHWALALGRDIDQPRNLAKSVTVE
ncbi:MAG: glutamine--fructose-6-phosphate transaminase (isomerizing) [Ectothiorhodospiraceae bacterium]|nr:glutamine--fructose-6-phosphate transaminase (isomerizing) [Chromatiales bacterium]MCP5154147.1 glutamine--fructose-6-phosphate transaminase (isomerizing) [Ectothiorhodospiraceae bacterium]